MKIRHRRCAGLDVHKKTNQRMRAHTPEWSSKTEVFTQTFGTFTDDLERLRDWLREHKVREVAMESTGVYWIPVWNISERGSNGRFELTLIHPQHVRALPGH